jgi:hypothetical protein
MTADGVAWVVLFPLFCALGAGNVIGVVVVVVVMVTAEGRWWCLVHMLQEQSCEKYGSTPQ